MFERFTERARQVVVLAQEEARLLKHNYIGTEHILLGLLREEEGIAARVLEALDITVERVRSQIIGMVGSGEEAPSGQIPFTPSAKKALELALREALTLGHNYIGTEHLLLGLVRVNEGDGLAIPTLLALGTTSEEIRNEVIPMLAADPGPPAGARSELVLGLPNGLLDGAGAPLQRLSRELEERLRRSADAGDLLVLLACVPDGFVARTLAALRVDVPSVARAVDQVRREEAGSALLPDAGLLAEAERVREEAEAALKARQADRVAELRIRERDLRRQARDAVDPGRAEEVLAEVRALLGLGEQ